MNVPVSTVAAEYIGFIVSFITNISLIFLIIPQTKQNFGSYKYLMLCFATWSLWYSIIDIIARPAMYIYKNAFIIICAGWFQYYQLAPFIIATYCSSYGLTIVLLTIHFAYRFFAICRPQDFHYFQYPLVLIWPAIFFGVGISWWCTVYTVLGVNDTMNQYIREVVVRIYDDDIGRLAYIGALYYLVGQNGEIEICWPTCLGMINLFTISTTSLTFILILGYRVHREMQKMRNMVAEKTQELQKQLFYALLVQTIVPIVFMFISAFTLFIAPLLSIQLGAIANITSIGLALYPALDPIVVMYFIRDYRNYISKMKVPVSTVSAEYIGFIVAFSANLLLIFLIITQTKQNFGSYKYLMLCFSLFSLWYSIVDIITQPAMLTHKNAFMVICSSWFKYDKHFGEIMATTYVTSYGLTVVLLSIHFIYRYIAISRPNDLRFFQYPLAFIWPGIFFSVALIWWGVVYKYTGMSETMNDYMRETVLLNYEEDIDKLGYIGPIYYFVDLDGSINFQWPVCIGMLYIMTVSSASLAVIVTLGFKIHQKMRRVQDMLAESTRELQRQLFYSLMVQTIVPFVLMFSPVSIISLSPVFGIELGGMANMTSICLALYPALDPIVVIFFIRDYRRFILKKFCNHTVVSPINTKASTTTRQSQFQTTTIN